MKPSLAGGRLNQVGGVYDSLLPSLLPRLVCTPYMYIFFVVYIWCIRVCMLSHFFSMINLSSLP